MLLDFTFNVYPEFVTAGSPALGLLPLQEGLYVVAGEQRDGKETLVYNETLNRLEGRTTRGGYERYDGPSVMFSVVKADLVVPQTVAALSTAYASRLAAAAKEGAAARESVRAELTAAGPVTLALDQFAARPTAAELRRVLATLANGPDPKAAPLAWGAASNIVMRATGCAISTREHARALAGQINVVTMTIAKNSFRLDRDVTCP